MTKEIGPAMSRNNKALPYGESGVGLGIGISSHAATRLAWPLPRLLGLLRVTAKTPREPIIAVAFV